MDSRKDIGSLEYDRGLFEKLKLLEGKQVKLVVKSGASRRGNIFKGRLNSVSERSAVSGKPYVSIDFGESEIFDIDNIVSVEAAE